MKTLMKNVHMCYIDGKIKNLKIKSLPNEIYNFDSSEMLEI